MQDSSFTESEDFSSDELSDLNPDTAALGLGKPKIEENKQNSSNMKDCSLVK